MSTVSQPRTPSAREIPVLEQRRSSVEIVTDRLETPSLDDRSYRVVKLPNQLEVLLVHDGETDKASAAMDVNVGNFSDPEELSGCAHAVEHLLFMGTKKYPIENAYASYLSANSGSSNAYTAATSTNYYFEVAARNTESVDTPNSKFSPLHGALDRFAQFFIEPLFLSSTLDREMRAVDSENKKNLQNDLWRLHQLDKSLTNPNHPYCHFSTGNFETLKVLPEARGVDVRQQFINFHEKHYSANRMKLVVLGREPLDVLEDWVAELFTAIRNKDLPQNRWEDEPVLGEKELLTQYFAKPVMEQRVLDLTFPFLDEEQLFESQPSRYVSHLIGHEGPGSIMSYIKGKGWANGLSAGADPVCPGTLGLFNIQIRLTEEGLKYYQEIVKIVFQYISLLRETPPQQWIFEEQKGIAEVEFKFKQKTPASKFTSKISAVMQRPLPREWLLSGNSRLRKFDPAAIEAGLMFLRPDNFRLSVVSQDFPGGWDRKEKWYGTEYKYEKIPLEFLAEVKQAYASSANDRVPELHLPHKNQFIPTKLEVEKKEVKEPATAPILIRNDEMMRTWFKKDDTFWVPKANVFINCRNPLPDTSAENSIKAKIYSDMVRDALEEYAYDAELAGLEYSISSYSAGLDIQVAGYNDKLSVLLEKVLTTMRDLEVKEDRFEVVKERLLRALRNWGFQQPYNQVGDYTRWLSSPNGFMNFELLDELNRVSAEDVRNFQPQLLQKLHIETLVHGNMYKEDALKLTNLIESTLKSRPLPRSQFPIKRSFLFPPGGNFVFKHPLKDPANVNHCIEYLLFVGEKADRLLRAKVLLLDQMTHEPAFDQLRTKEQLGYVVFSGSRATSTTIGYRFIIQSEKAPEYLEKRIDAFLTSYSKILYEMPEVEFEGHKRSLITKRLEKLKNLDQESGRLWTHVESEFFDFDLVHHDAEHIKILTKADMIKFFDSYISTSSPTRSKIAIHLYAQGTSEQPADIIKSLNKRLTEMGIEPQPAQLQRRLTAAGSGQAGIHEALRSHLLHDLKMAAEKVARILEDGMKALHLKHSKEEAAEAEPAAAPPSKPSLIDDVRAFKSMLAISPGPRPVKDLSEFEELDSKL